MKTMKRKIAVCAVLALAVAGIAVAAVDFNPATGTGFVGKGDVQLVFGWNNKALQDNAHLVRFQASSVVETERSWTCTNSNNQNEQVRERTTTTTIEGLVTKVDRVKNQITGFILDGYTGTPTESSETDGPAVNSCPSGPWTLTTPAGDPVQVSDSSVLQVSEDGGTTWVDLQ